MASGMVFVFHADHQRARDQEETWRLINLGVIRGKKAET